MPLEQDVSFEALYRANYKKLMRYAAAKLDNPGQAEEVVQDTFYTAWNNRETLLQHKAPGAYLMTTLKYKIKECRRARQRYLHLFLSLDSGLQAEAAAPGDPVSSGVKNLMELIESNLSPDEWHLLRRHVFEGASHLELARELGVTVWTSQKRLERIRKKLREILPDP